MSKHENNRETWLLKATDGLRPLFKRAGHELPAHIRIGVGFPSIRGLSVKKPRIGECWSVKCAADGARELIVSPRLHVPLRVLDVLTHELGHCCFEDKVGHKAPFAKLMKGLGLEGKPTATVAGAPFIEATKTLLGKLGPYPHAELTALRERKVQSTRLIKVECGGCGYVARVTHKWLEEAGAPICPACETQMEEA